MYFQTASLNLHLLTWGPNTALYILGVVTQNFQMKLF